MIEILHQLVELFFEALPIIILVFLFYLFLNSFFFKPLLAAMDEREKRIAGAKEEAEAAQAAARDEMSRYNEEMKKARAEIYAEQEAARQAALDERAKLLRTLRARNQEQIEEAKQRIASEYEAARAEVEKESPALASQIMMMILERSGPANGGGK